MSATPTTSLIRLVHKKMIPTSDTLQRAHQILQNIEALHSELAGLFTGTDVPAPKRRGRPPGSGKVPHTTIGEPVKRTRRMSPEGSARIAAAAKARWARHHADKAAQTGKGSSELAPTQPTRKGSGMSASGRAAIAAAQKARWAKVRAQKKKSARA